MEEKPMEYFPIFLIIGLVIIAVLMVGFNLPTGEVVERERPPMLIKDINGSYFIGAEKKEEYSVVKFGVDAVNERESIKKDLGTFRIYNGLMFGANAKSYRLSMHEMDAVNIKFEILSTNKYGNMILRVNGMDIVNENLDEGVYEFEVMPDSDIALIEVMVASSGWRVWAPALYDINMQLEASGYKEHATQYHFSIDRFEELKNGKLNLVFDENVGELDILINHYLVYSGPMRNLDAVDIEKQFFTDKDNLLTIVPHKDSRFKGKANLALFFDVPELKVMRTVLNFTISELEQLPGTVEFDVIEVLEPGAMSVKLYNDEYEMLYSDFAKVNEGTYRFVFNNAGYGVNYLVVESLDGAKFYLKDLDVSL